MDHAARSAALPHAPDDALPLPLAPRPFRVVERVEETADTFTIDLEPLGAPPAPFTPGQFTMLYAFGVGEVPISISGDPARSDRLTHTVREVGGVTAALARLAPGDVLGVRGPFGRPWPVAGSSSHPADLVLVAGGIGLAPLRPVLFGALAARERYRRVVLLYGARTPDELLYRDELARWREGGDIDVHVIVDHAPAGWPHPVGVVTSLVERAPFDPEACLAMICGPEVMMRFGVRALLARGVDPARIHLSLERNMKCAVALCGRCQFGPTLVCRDGPVFAYPRVRRLLDIPGL